VKIWILNHYASVPKLGGAETRHYDFARIWVSKGHSVRIFIGSYSHLTEDEMPRYVTSHSGEAHEPAFTVIKTRRYKRNGVDRFLSCRDYYLNGRKMLNTLEEKPDVVIASSPHPYAWQLGRVISKRFGCPLIVEVRDIWPWNLIAAGKMSRMNPAAIIFSRIEKIVYIESAKIISLASGFDAHVANIAGNKYQDKVLCIPNGVDMTKFHDHLSSPEIDELLKPFKGKFLIGYAGSHGPTKDLETVLKGIYLFNKDLPKSEVYFLFVGRGSEKNKLMKLSEKLHLRNVRFLDPIPKEQVPAFIKYMDALLFSCAEVEAHSSYKLLDAMASGKPMISADLPDIPVKETKDAIFYTPGNEKEFCQAVKKLVSSDTTKFGSKNKTYIYKERNIFQLALKFEEVLLEVVKRRKLEQQ